MNKQTIGIYTAFSLVLFGAYSCSPSQNQSQKSAKNSKTVSFPHDTELDTYLTSARNFLLEIPNPRDKRFGVTRVPMLSHNVDSKNIPGYKEILELQDYTFDSFVVGQSLLKDPHSPGLSSKYRINRLPSSKGFGQNFEPGWTKTIEQIKDTVDKGDYETYSQAIKINGCSGWMMVKPVRASDGACYKCHADIKPGQPIGHVMAAIWRPYKD